MLAIQVVEVEGVTILRPLSELTSEVANQWRNRFQELKVGQQVVVDLNGVSFMDSAGLGVLIGGIRRVRENGGEVVLSCAQPALQRLIRMTGLDKVVDVSHDAEAASQALRNARSQ